MKSSTTGELRNPNDLRAKHALRISIILIVTLIGTLGPNYYLAQTTKAWQISLLTDAAAFGAVLSILALWYSLKKRIEIASYLMIGTVILLTSFAIFFINGIGLFLGISGLIVIYVIAQLTLIQPQLTRVTIIAIVFGLAVILLDTFFPYQRLEIRLLTIGIPILAVISVGIFAYFASREFGNYSLGTKLVIFFIAITMVPLVSLGVYANIRLRNALNQNAQQSLTQLANQTALQVDTFISDQLNLINIESQNPVFARFLSLSSSESKGGQEELEAYNTLATLVHPGQGNISQGYINSFALLDSSGVVVLDTGKNLGKNASQTDYFKKALTERQSVVTGPIFNQQTGNAYIYFSAPVKNATGSKTLGVLYVEYNANIIELIVGNLIQPGNPNGILLRIVNKDNYVRIAHTGNLKLLYTSYKNFTSDQVIALQQQELLLPGPIQNVLAAEPDTVAGLENINQQPFFTTLSKTLGANTLNTAKTLKSVPWLAFVRQSQAVIQAPLQVQTRTIILIALLLLGIVTLAALRASQIIAQPVIKLASVAQDITAGNLHARAQITSQDEIGELALSFNQMTSQLQDTLGGLERRIAERTADVELARLLSERRAQDLQAISEVSRTISTEQRLEILLPLVTRLVSEQFDFYHVGIFFVDATKQFAVLQAANSEGGKRMLDRGHRLEVGLTGIVGAVAENGKARIALDVGSDATYFDNPDLPQTRSEMALPLNFRGETIGILDVQSVKPGAFTESDASTLSILADQIAIAIENARLFGQTQQARDEAEALYNQFQKTEWNAFLQRETTIGYSQSAINGRPLATPVDNEEIRTALQKGQVVVFDGKSTKAQPTIAIPVKLRGQTIGVLNIKAPTKNRKWNQDEINLAQAVSDRLALALDNARLLQESQRRASKEAKIGEVTAKIGASINMRNVLQTAVEELGRALPGSEVIIQFQDTSEN